MAVVYCGFCVVFGRDLARGYGHGENCTYPETLSKQAACGLLKKNTTQHFAFAKAYNKALDFSPFGPQYSSPCPNCSDGLAVPD